LLDGPTALRHYRLEQAPNSRRVHVLLPMSVHRRSTGFVVVRRTIHPPLPVWSTDDTPLAPAARAVVDTCLRLTDQRAVRAIVAEAVQRRRTTIEALLVELVAAPSAGSAVLRRVLKEVA